MPFALCCRAMRTREEKRRCRASVVFPRLQRQRHVHQRRRRSDRREILRGMAAATGAMWPRLRDVGRTRRGNRRREPPIGAGWIAGALALVFTKTTTVLCERVQLLVGVPNSRDGATPPAWVQGAARSRSLARHGHQTCCRISGASEGPDTEPSARPSLQPDAGKYDPASVTGLRACATS